MNAKQSLVLTGLGLKAFDNNVRAIMEIHSRFASDLPADTLQPWFPAMDDNDMCIELSNRYFTPEYLAGGYEKRELDDLVDPLGLLKTHAHGGRHTEDNEVLYFERIVEQDNR